MRFIQQLMGLSAISLGMITSIAFAQSDSSSYDNQPETPAAIAPAGVTIDAGNEVGTAESSFMKGAASLQLGLGKRAYFQSLSAINLQKAIDLNLDNRREAIESYYEMRDLRDEAVADKNRPTNEDAVRFAKLKAPDRLTSQDFDEKTGEVFLPEPLDSPVLKPYTRVIQEAFEKRAKSGNEYTNFDARRVERMVRLVQGAVDSIKTELPVEEYIALSDYLDSVHYEASFNNKGERVTQ